jgi:hypothetical protein
MTRIVRSAFRRMLLMLKSSVLIVGSLGSIIPIGIPTMLRPRTGSRQYRLHMMRLVQPRHAVNSMNKSELRICLAGQEDFVAVLPVPILAALILLIF